MWIIFSLFRSKKPLARETDKIENLDNFGMPKFTKTPILQNCQMPNGFFARHIIQEYNFCQLSQLFIVSVSLASGFLKERDKIFSTYSGTSYLPDFLTDSSLALKPWPICALPQGYYPHV